MKKAILDRFIAKYNLAGAAESVTWNADSKSLSTRCISDDKNILGEISTPELSMTEGDYGIFDTTLLRSMIGVLDEDISIDVNQRPKDNKNVSLLFADNSTKVTFMLADAVPDVPNLKTLPGFDMEVYLDSKFVNTFVRAKNALAEVETFTVIPKEDSTEIVLGYSANNVNANKVAFEIEPEPGAELDRPISFSARYMKDILLANKECRGGTMKISSQGLAHVTFDVDDFTVAYYLVEMQI